MRVRLVVPALAAALAACAPDPGSVDRSGYSVAAIPADDEIAATASLYRETVRRSERLGRAIFEMDYATGIATELLFRSRALGEDERIIGWVTQEGEGSLMVTYVAEEDGRRLVGYEVAFPGGPSGTPTIAPTAPGTALVGERARMYNARETAYSEFFLQRQCPTRYNTVVLPASLIGEQGWLVYLLVPTNPGERVLGGHAVVRVSSDGLTSLGARALSLTCRIEQVQLPAGTEQSGIFLVHTTSAWPLETHVYTSLFTGLPVYVQTSAGTWTVDGDSIELTNLTAAR